MNWICKEFCSRGIGKVLRPSCLRSPNRRNFRGIFSLQLFIQNILEYPRNRAEHRFVRSRGIAYSKSRKAYYHPKSLSDLENLCRIFIRQSPAASAPASEAMLSPHPLTIHPKLNKKFRENSAISATQGNGAIAPSRFRANKPSLSFPLLNNTRFK